MYHKRFLKFFFISPYGLLPHFLFLLAAVTWLVWTPLHDFMTLDPKPDFLRDSSAAIAKKFARLPSTKKTPEVQVGFSLTNFAEFDITNNKFIAEGIVWFLYNPQEISLDKLKEFSFDKGAIREKSEPTTEHRGELDFSRFYVRFNFTTHLSYRNFPLDDHRIFIILKVDDLLLGDVKFLTSIQDFPDSVGGDNPGWVLVSKDAEAGYTEVKLRENETIVVPRVVFSLDYVRSGVHLLVTILLPLLLLFFVALAVFLIEVPTIFDASSTFMGSLFALTTYLYVIKSVSPDVGYVMLADLLFFAVIFCTFLIANLGWTGSDLQWDQRTIIGAVVELLLVGAFFYILHIWYYNGGHLALYMLS